MDADPIKREALWALAFNRTAAYFFEFVDLTSGQRRQDGLNQ